jgi:predicted branched-subunit amino acid permease
LRPHLLIASRSIPLVLGAVGVALVPWTIWLSSTLSPHHSTENWDLAWSGFDTGLAACFMLTAVAAWRRSTLLTACAAATGALLVADAWFDIVLESRSNDLEVSLIEAFAAELPLAGLCFWLAVTSRAGRREPGRA